MLLVFAAALGCGSQMKPVTTAPQTSPSFPEERRAGVLVLGSPHLFAGIPGAGPLKPAEIRTWLANPDVHTPLKVVLPLGLDTLVAEDFIPAENPLTRAKIELGRQLFFDRRLSRGGNRGCVDCHAPRQAYANYFFDQQRREPPAAFNRLLSTVQFWDGRATALETQPRIPLEAADELDLPPEELVSRLKAIPGYRLQFETIFGETTFDSIGAALACFQRALVSGPAPWDYHATYERLSPRPADELTADEAALLAHAALGRERFPLSAAALRGSELFFSERTGCSVCHTGPNFTDESFHNTGAGTDRPQPDEGRFRVTSREEDRGAFKTPTLRNLARSGPYLHDARFSRLVDVVNFFCDGGIENSHRSPLLNRLELTVEERRDLVAFLESLNGALPEPNEDRLPE